MLIDTPIRIIQKPQQQNPNNNGQPYPVDSDMRSEECCHHCAFAKCGHDCDDQHRCKHSLECCYRLAACVFARRSKNFRHMRMMPPKACQAMPIVISVLRSGFSSERVWINLFLG